MASVPESIRVQIIDFFSFEIALGNVYKELNPNSILKFFKLFKIFKLHELPELPCKHESIT